MVQNQDHHHYYKIPYRVPLVRLERSVGNKQLATSTSQNWHSCLQAERKNSQHQGLIYLLSQISTNLSVNCEEEMRIPLRVEGLTSKEIDTPGFGELGERTWELGKLSNTETISVISHIFFERGKWENFDQIFGENLCISPQRGFCR